MFRKFNLDSSLIYISNVRKEELACLYHHAFAMIYPSLYEGFGLPPLEAMSCGCPVVASNSSSIPEVVRESGLLIDPYDVDSASSAFNQLLLTNVRDSLIKKGLLRAKLFSWDVVAKRYMEIYQYLA